MQKGEAYCQIFGKTMDQLPGSLQFCRGAKVAASTARATCRLQGKIAERCGAAASQRAAPFRRRVGCPPRLKPGHGLGQKNHLRRAAWGWSPVTMLRPLSDDQDLIGTASYDGYVKLWRISTHESVREMYAGKEQLLYGLAFGPGATKVCCVSGSGMLFIFKVDTGETLVKQQVHTGQGFRCEWNQRGPCYIATGGNDGYACVVNEKDGSVVSRLTHPSAVFGVAWHPMQATHRSRGEFH
eukprot:s1011_g5.t1